METSALPAAAGSYVLLLRTENPLRLTVGRLGDVALPAGWHLYVGSAHGPGGLRGRLAHHLRPVQKPHWHIDWLRAVADVRKVWFVVGRERCECVWAEALAAQPGAARLIGGFGASDCGCAGHLITVAVAPRPAEFAHWAGVSGRQVRAVR